ncbi:hypothetical protein Nepgr_010626 [Nepenthes gracilis]|uniref:Retrotransposon gag domain-containing protein n=1 Tax=Nepenthes gracilis TaxID=150966 RepID=A0AAD3SDI6_NEPGR|nr:hypothetical protein Nepgr_010626 [Nepenthes gracilis]
MVNTRAQASDPARDVISLDQNHIASTLVNGTTGGAPTPFFQQLMEQMRTNNRLLRILCSRLEQTLQAAPAAAVPAPATIKGESLERRNPRYSRAENGNTVQERAYRAARSAEGSSLPDSRPSRDKTELRAYLNSKRSANAARADPRVDKIWKRVFQDDERAIDLDKFPFTAEILNRPLPTKFKMSSLDSYDGSSDPINHLDYFYTNMSLQGLEDSAMCHCFRLTLKGDARIWFHHLPSGTISSFRELTYLFLTQYASSQREEKQPRILRITEEIKLDNFISALTYENFFKHLAHKNPRPFGRPSPSPGHMQRQRRSTKQNIQNEQISLDRSLERKKENMAVVITPAESSTELGHQNAEITGPPTLHP